MKITGVETLICHARMRNWVFIKVRTDQDGLWGWGEATLEWHTRAVAGAVMDLAQLLVGEDPRRIEHLWQMMYRQHFWRGSGVVRGTAIGGIDLALWDILGKIHGVPCHRLWGGPVRDYVRTYCHLGGGRMEDTFGAKISDTHRFTQLAERAVRDGFTAFKCLAVPETMPLEGIRPLKQVESCVAAMREAVGDGVDIIIDCHSRPSPRMGLMFAKMVEPYGPFWLEEPCWTETLDGLADIQRAVATPIAAGERLAGIHAFIPMLEKRAVSVIQPDILHCGGLSEARRIAAVAEAYRVAIAPHNSQGPVSTAASLELGFATPSYLICETLHQDVPWRQDVVKEGFTVEVNRRVVRPSDRPGLGIEINENEAKKHPFQQELPQRSFYPDGSIGDS